jgi:hypothetical protein
MPSLSVFPYSRSQPPQQILDDIEAQFHIDDDTLKEIVSQFLKEFETGLGEYNYPMAMMCVMHRGWKSSISVLLLIYLCSPSFISGVPNGTETGSDSCLHRKITFVLIYLRLGHSWPSTLEARTCTVFSRYEFLSSPHLKACLRSNTSR